MTLRIAVPVVLLAIVALLPLVAPWSQVVLTLALAKGLAVLRPRRDQRQERDDR